MRSYFTIKLWLSSTFVILYELMMGPFWLNVLQPNYTVLYYKHRAWCDVVFKALRYYSDGLGIDSRWCNWIFQWHISFRPHHGHGVDSAPSENEYQEHFLRIKADGAWGWRSHHLRVSNFMEIWEPKPPGTLWATPGLLRDRFTLIL